MVVHCLACNVTLDAYLSSIASETVLVTAAAGGVGLAAVDLACHVLGAKVVNTSSISFVFV